MFLTRRELLAHSRNLLFTAGFGSLFSGLTLVPKFARAASLDEAFRPDHFFVLLRTFGGMDATLGLDPWILPSEADAQDMFLEYRPDQIITAEGLKLGPAAASLAIHAKESLIINGVMMRRDAGHEVDNLYMLTGGGDGKSASVPVELALALGTGPFGVVVNGPTYLAGKAASMTETSDLTSQTDQEKLIAFIEERLKLSLASQGTPWEQAQKELVASKEASLLFMKSLKSMETLGEKIGPAHVAAAAFASGGARQAQIEVPFPQPGLDTHSGHENVHLGVQKAGWEWISSVFSLFKKIPYQQGVLFDRTTFLVMSEFSRTPALNAAKGKDHNPFTNSVLLAGAGVQGGKVVGASKLNTRKQTVNRLPIHIGWPFNFKTGQLATGPEGASFIFPENVIRTVGALFGDPVQFQPVPSSTHLIPGIVRKDFLA